MSDKLWQQIMYILNDMFAINTSIDGSCTHKKAVQIKVVPDCLENPMCLCYVPF